MLLFSFSASAVVTPRVVAIAVVDAVQIHPTTVSEVFTAPAVAAVAVAAEGEDTSKDGHLASSDRKDEAIDALANSFH